MQTTIQTYKIKHGLKSNDFIQMFDKAYKIACKAHEQRKLGNKLPTTKFVKEIGLHSVISCQVIRKYYNNKRLKIKMIIFSIEDYNLENKDDEKSDIDKNSQEKKDLIEKYKKYLNQIEVQLEIVKTEK